MASDNIAEGRQRAIEVLNQMNPEDGEVLYGDYNGGVGYCSFKYLADDGQTYAVTVRTANRHFVKIDPRLLKTNISAAENCEIEHALIVGFNWKTTKDLFLVRNCMDYVHHTTKGWNYQVFVKEHLDSLLNGEENGRDIQLL